MYCPGASSPLGLRDRGVQRARGSWRWRSSRRPSRARRRRRWPARSRRRCRTPGTAPGTGCARCRWRRGPARPGCPRRSRPPTARCRPSAGSSSGSRVSAVSILSVLAGRSRPCGSLAASTSPVVEVGEQVGRGADLGQRVRARERRPPGRRWPSCSPPTAAGRCVGGRRAARRADEHHAAAAARSQRPALGCPSHRGQANGRRAALAG